MTPLAIDLFCGLGGWTEGLLAEGYDVIGFDIERHDYGTGGYPAQLVLQDVLTLHGRQFKDAALIVASPPCQEFSYMAMPWSKAKAKRAAILADPAERKRLTALFDACFRIQREAIEAAGHFIPLVVENVRGANEWVGRSMWNFGSFHLWGDVPALMPMSKAIKNNGGSWFAVANNTTSGHSRNPVHELSGQKGISHRTKGHRTNPAESDGVNFGCPAKEGGACGDDPMFWCLGCPKRASADGVKQHKSGRAWFADPDSISGSTSSKSNARKAASAAIAKIPFALAQHIARVYFAGTCREPETT